MQTHKDNRATVLASLGLVATLFAGHATAESTIGLGAVESNGETGFVFSNENTPLGRPDIATEIYIQEIDYGTVKRTTFKGGVGLGTRLPGQIDHSLSGLIGVRADNYSQFTDEYGGYATARYRYQAMDRIQLGADVSYTNMGTTTGTNLDVSGVTITPTVRYAFTEGVYVEGKYLNDVGDVEGYDQIVATFRVTY